MPTGPEPTWRPQIVEVVGRFVAASNATLLARTGAGEQVVYKPVAGESPLWDFPHGSLAIREVLTFRVDRAMGLGVVPETVLGDGEFGPGSIQRYLDWDETADPLPAIRRGAEELWPVAVLDVVCNNADRKVGHLLPLRDGTAYAAIDHGLTFHPADKLRTVLWAFAGRTLPAALLTALETLLSALGGPLGDEVARSLGAGELDALRTRADRLLAAGVHPEPPADRPAIPWPPY